MQQQEYSQISDFGLGSLVGDFFQNVKDVVGDVAKKVAPIAPYVIPFVAPQLGITSAFGRAALGAGIGALAGQKPVDIAKNLALQTGIGGLSAIFGRPEGQTISEAFKQGAFGDITKDRTISSIGDIKESRLNPFSKASQFKPTEEAIQYAKLAEQYPEQFTQTYEDLLANTTSEILSSDMTDLEKMSALSKVPKAVTERGFMGQYGPAAAAGLAAVTLPSLLSKPEEEEYDDTFYSSYVPNEYYYDDPAKYQLLDITGPQGYDPGIYLSADGGEVTGGVQNSGQRIKHSDGKVREHPKRIGEIAGAGTGTSDDIPAMLSDGEFVMTAKAVRNAGGGSRKAGAKKMYQMMKSLEKGGSLSPQSIGMA